MEIRRQAVCSWIIATTMMMMAYPSSHNDSTDGRPIIFRLMEEQPAGTLVGSLAEQVTARYRLELEVERQLQFQLIFEENDDEAGAFSFGVDAESGLLTATRSIDREEICLPSSQWPSHQVSLIHDGTANKCYA